MKRGDAVPVSLLRSAASDVEHRSAWMRDDRRPHAWGLTLLALTSVHHVWGVFVYGTPDRLHAVILAAIAAIFMIGGRVLQLHRAGTTAGWIGGWVSRGVNAGVVILFGAIEGFYNHVLKVALFLVGIPESGMRFLYRSSMFEMPNDVVFEATGVLQAVPAVMAALTFVPHAVWRGSLLSRATTFALIVVRVTGPVQVVLGILFWLGLSRGVLLHIVIGITLVLALWMLGLLAARASVGIGPAVLALALGVFTIWFGINHPAMLPGPLHWLVRVAHLAVGIVAMATAHGLAQAIRRRISESDRRSGR